MKKYIIGMSMLALASLSILSCKKKEVITSEAKEVEQVVIDETYKADATKTMVIWNASKLVGGHQGTINASNGILNIKGNALVGGNFIFDINTISCSDIPAGEKNDKLIAHLKGEDFFDVEKHANAAFQITSVTAKEGKSIIAGNLTIKGIKKNVEFPATVSIANGVATISSDEFFIDRTEWGINYSSGKFTDPAKLGDYLIKDKVGIKIAVAASK